MEPIPAYLLVYLWRIHRHADEPGYLVKRAKAGSVKVATYEQSMLREMQELHLVGLSEDEDISFPGPTTVSTQNVKMPGMFVILARGHYAWTEVAVPVAQWLLAALIGGLIAGLLG